MLGAVALDEQRAPLGVEAQGEQARRHLAGPRRGSRPRRGCSSARGSRRCSRSPRTRTGASRSCGSRPGRCRGGRCPDGWMPREDPRARRAGAASGAGAGASSTVIAAECSGARCAPAASERAAFDTIARQPTPSEHGPREPSSPCASACIGAGTVGREVVRALPRALAAARRRRTGRRSCSPASPSEIAERAIANGHPGGAAHRRAGPSRRDGEIDVLVELDGRRRAGADAGRAPRLGAGKAS